MIKKLLTALVLCVGLALPASAAVTYNKDTKSLSITGTTTMNQVTKVWEAFTQNEINTVFMSGPGGGYYAGLSLGRLLKQKDVRIIIPSGSYCASACAFAALGGKTVFIDGELWFHAPYSRVVDPGATIRDISKAYGIVYLDMLDYLLEVMQTKKQAVDFSKAILKETSVCRFIVWGGDAPVIKDFCK
jgi:hypothetical protein